MSLLLLIIKFIMILKRNVFYSSCCSKAIFVRILLENVNFSFHLKSMKSESKEEIVMSQLLSIKSYSTVLSTISLLWPRRMIVPVTKNHSNSFYYDPQTYWYFWYWSISQLKRRNNCFESIDFYWRIKRIIIKSCNIKFLV